MKKNLPTQPSDSALPEDHEERMRVYAAHNEAWRKWDETVLAAFESSVFTLADVKAMWRSAYESGLERGADGGSSLASWLFSANEALPDQEKCSQCEKLYTLEELRSVPPVILGEGGTVRDGTSIATYWTKTYRCSCGGSIMFTKGVKP